MITRYVVGTREFKNRAAAVRDAKEYANEVGRAVTVTVERERTDRYTKTRGRVLGFSASALLPSKSFEVQPAAKFRRNPKSPLKRVRKAYQGQPVRVGKDGIARFKYVYSQSERQSMFNRTGLEPPYSSWRAVPVPNPKSPLKRVRKALKKYVRKALGKKNPKISELTARQLEQIRSNIKAPEYSDAETREAMRNAVGDGYKVSDFLPRRKRAKKNPDGRRDYQVHVPAAKGDRGYEIKVKAPTASSALAAARKYCAGRVGKSVREFHLPRGTKARAV